jgi:large subunit ribosomal protein L26e
VAISESAADKMKFNLFVTSDGSKNSKRHFSAPAHIHRKIMSSPLPTKLKQNYKVPSMPLESMMVFGFCQGPMEVNYEGTMKTSKVAQVYQKNMPSILNRYRGKDQQHSCPCGHSPQQGGYH